MVHLRGVLEETLKTNRGLVLACLDLDLKNAFPSFEWDSIREAVDKYMPKLKAWTSWCHEQAAVV